MALLTDTSIRNLLVTTEEEWIQNQNEKLLILGFDEECLTPVGYDLRVGKRYLKMRYKLKEFEELDEDEELVILPGEIVAIETEEEIKMPQNKGYSGILVSKVSIAEEGLSHISTSLDPDYKGKMLITVTNLSQRRIVLKRKQPFCTMILFKNETPATKECGKHPDRHITKLIKKWGIIEKKRRRILTFWILKIFFPAIPLIWLFMNYLIKGVTGAEVALFVAISSFLFVILDKALRTE